MRMDCSWYPSVTLYLHVFSHTVHVIRFCDNVDVLLLFCRDPEGLRSFYYLVQDLKCMVFSLIGLHFKIKPI